MYWQTLKRLSASPLVGVPLSLGLATWCLGLMVEPHPGFLSFVGVSGVLFGIGSGVTQWILNGRQLQQLTQEESLCQRR